MITKILILFVVTCYSNGENLSNKICSKKNIVCLNETHYQQCRHPGKPADPKFGTPTACRNGELCDEFRGLLPCHKRKSVNEKPTEVLLLPTEQTPDSKTEPTDLDEDVQIPANAKLLVKTIDDEFNDGTISPESEETFEDDEMQLPSDSTENTLSAADAGGVTTDKNINSSDDLTKKNANSKRKNKSKIKTARKVMNTRREILHAANKLLSNKKDLDKKSEEYVHWIKE